ncbi:hypothetical protein SK128_026691 [Halocaridina rubra]|uniref:Uncharacterized protein n=1 Tax=Halocaridina rubra TaxID=373956 RepID=A0AAN8ZZZ7_HALRR
MPTTMKPEPDICKNSNSCANAGGFCDYNCPPEARMDSLLCEGNCTCCLPPGRPLTHCSKKEIENNFMTTEHSKFPPK